MALNSVDTKAAEPSPSLTLGPLLFHWDRDTWRDFYSRIADEAPVDRVCLGEVVCSKRLPFYADLLPGTIERLERGGKTVVLSSLALITLDRERKLSAELAEGAPAEIEINDLTLLRHVREGQRFAVGPFINVYNEATLGFLASRGANHICLPPELPQASVEKLAAAGRDFGVAVEVWSFGRIPLALSARCYHARVHGLAKDSCQFVCGNDPDGLPVETLDGEPILAVNGIQTLSDAYCSLISELRDLAEIGVGSFRLSPQACDMVAVAELYRGVMEKRMDKGSALQSLHQMVPGAQFANGFLVGTHGAQLRPSRG